MKTGVDCLVCFMQQALTAAKQCSKDVDVQRKILLCIAEHLKDVDMQSSPPVNLAKLYKIISEKTNIRDPFSTIKKKENDFALTIEKSIEEIINQATDPLFAAIRFAIGGNVLDSGSQFQLDINSTLSTCLDEELAINDYSELQTKLAKSRRVLYLADNCGEIVFDKLVISKLRSMGLDVTIAVRGIPVINDATIEDAIYCGIDEVCSVISNGAGVPGTSLKECSREFQDLFYGADCIISKGMGNFESLSDIQAPIFFLLTIKCSTVLNYLKGYDRSTQLQIGSPILVGSNASQ